MLPACRLVLLGLVLCLLPLPAAAGKKAALRAVVRVLTPEDEELLRRLLGQTVDMDVVLIPVRERPLEDRPSDQIAAARELAGAHQAQAVVWVRRPPQGAAEVCVAAPGKDPQALLARQVGTGAPAADPVSRSASAEGAALVVRSALRALAQDEPLPAPAPVPAPRPTQSKKGPALHWQLGLGWQVAMDGQSPAGQHGLSLRAGLDRGPLLLALTVAAGLPATLSDDLTAVDLSRYTATLFLGYGRRLSPRFYLSGGAAAGILLFYRSTQVLGDPPPADLMPTPPRLTPAFLAAPEARILFRPFRPSAQRKGRPALWLEASVAADVIAGAPELGYQAGTVFQTRNQLWPVQPRAGLALVLWSL